MRAPHFSATGYFATCLVALALVTMPGLAEAKDKIKAKEPEWGAEYAVRWYASQGGPQTAREAAEVLNVPVMETEDLEVRYFDFDPPKPTPMGAKAILRERIKPAKGKYQLMLKYRSDEALPPPFECPLDVPFDAKEESKLEIDISVVDGSPPKRVYSYSCTVKRDAQAIPPPAGFNAKAKGCTLKMHRETASLAGAELKIEQWDFPGGDRVIEVSRNAADDDEALDAFRKDIVDPLVTAKVKPVADGKTQLAAGCK